MKKYLIVLLSVLMLLSSCRSVDNQLEFVNFRGLVFGTYYSISYFCEEGNDYQASLDSLFADINSSLSYYDATSTISRINRNETNRADAYFQTVLKRSLEIAEETHGAFDPTVSPLVNAWGFGVEERSEMTPGLVDSLKSLVGYEKVSLDGDRVLKTMEGLQFDFNAIAKGYGADLAGEFLESRGIESYLVELGGDLVAKGVKPDGTSWRIGLEKPASDMYDEQEWAFMVEIEDQGLATSGSYRQYYEQDGQRFSHTIDPETGWPVDHNLLSVSVLAPDCMTADAFATAFMVMGLEKSKQFVNNRDDLQAFFIYDRGDGEYGTYNSEGLNVMPREAM